MYKDSNNTVQCRFTAYLRNAIRNRKINYLYRKKKLVTVDLPVEDYEIPAETPDEYITRLAEYEAVQVALRMIRERERYVLLARIIDEKDFGTIGKELGIGYKGAAAVFYRTVEKLRRILGGDNDEF